MPERCTCGAQLPPDARFCHKCGKPQFDYPVPDTEPVAAAPPPLQAIQLPSPAEIGFHNRTAVRVSFLLAAIAFLLTALPMPVFVTLIWVVVLFLAAGFVTVLIYSRRTGQTLNVRAGARLGWMTGIFSFTASLILLTLEILNFSDLKEQAARQDPRFRDMAILLGDRGLMIGIIVGGLIIFFVLFGLLPIVGGALCAKVLEKD